MTRHYPGVPLGLEVWFEYDETLRSPKGRLLVDKDGRGVPRQRTTAHLVRVIPAEAEHEAVTVRREVARGVAVCRPDEPFVRAIGRETALERALARLEGSHAT